MPSSSAAASANHSSGGRSGSERNRASASNPTGSRVLRSTIGWTWIESPSPATNRWISARAGTRSCSSSISSRRSCDDSSSTIPSTTSADTLARPLGDAMDRVDDLLGRGALDEVADRAGAEHLEDRRAVLERRQRDHSGAGRGARDLAGRAGPAAGRHAHVDERDVGQLALGERRRPRPRRRRRRRARAWAPARGASDRASRERRLVVGHQDADMRVAVRRGRGALTRRDASIPAGRCNSTRPGRDGPWGRSWRWAAAAA